MFVWKSLFEISAVGSCVINRKVGGGGFDSGKLPGSRRILPPRRPLPSSAKNDEKTRLVETLFID